MNLPMPQFDLPIPQLDLPRINAGFRSRFLPRRRLPGLRGNDRYIVGKDNRLLVSDSPLVESSAVLRFDQERIAPFRTAIQATALVISRNALRPTRDGKLWIGAIPERMQGTQYDDVPRVRAGIRGTAFLVTDSHLVTALHVVDRSALSRAAFVFGYNADTLCDASADLPRRYEFEQANVFFGKDLFAADDGTASDDLAIVELDRRSGRSPLAIAALDELVLNQEVALAGHARLQPLTLTLDIDRKPPLPGVFRFDDRIVYSTIDAFQGNSGSALLDMRGDVLGVHVDIEAEDYDDATSQAARYPDDFAAAAAVRMRVVGARLAEIGATIRSR